MSTSLSKIQEEVQWLRDHPEFDQRPATLLEFLGDEYLAIDDKVRESIKRELGNIMGHDVRADRPTEYPYAMITGGIGIGKGQRSSDTVASPTGEVKMGNLEVGDEVIGADGKPTRVTGVYRRGVLPVFRVTLKDGSSLVVDGDHLWAVDRQINVRGEGRRWRREVVSTRELMDRKLKYGTSYVYKVPLVEPIQYEKQDLKVHPYIMGAVIANGHVSGSVRVAGPGGSMEEFEKYLVEHLPKSVKPIVDGERDGANFTLATWPSSASNPILTAFREYGLGDVKSRDKFIPEPYLLGSPEDRLELLRGLMDCDGSATEHGNRSMYSTSSERLASDVARLVRSLGGYCTVTSFERKGWTEYHVHVNMDKTCPYRLSRKAQRWQPRTNQRPARSIVNIEPEGEDEVVCISVEAEDSLYVAGEDLIVTHNTTVASIVLPYLCHWVLCLKDPQDFFNLLPGSRIAFMQMSTSEKQALEVVFGDIKARVEHSPWFMNNYPMDPKFKNQIRFAKDIWILPGDSSETSFEGYNILGGILDEADSHKVTKQKDYAEQGYTTISSRITSRFEDRGFLLVIGQMKKSVGFAASKFEEYRRRPDAYAVRMSIWESLGWDHYADEDGNVDTFKYDAKRKMIVPKGVAQFTTKSENIIEIPKVFENDFRNNPEKALRDLAGIPPVVGDPFISLVHKIEDCRDRWKQRHGTDESPVTPEGRIQPWFRCRDSLKRVGHLDIAYSGEGDALGFAMGHVREMVQREEEYKPYIVIDLLLRMQAPAGSEIFLGDVRSVIYSLKNDFGFKLEFVSMDGFESTDTKQQFRRKRINSDIVSIDRDLLPYHDLREAIYEDRIEFPPHMVKYNRGDTELTEIAVKELMELVDEGGKIDHPPDGSKDVSDAIAGVTFRLMGDRRYHKKVVRLADHAAQRAAAGGGSRPLHPAQVNKSGASAPIPPDLPSWARPPR